MDKKQLEQILKECLEWNVPHHISGILIYLDGTFLQVIEGEGHAVDEIFEKISNDSRHIGVTKLLDEEIPSREFDVWEMSFRAINKEDLKAYEDFVDLDDLDFRGTFHEMGGKKLLKSFYELNKKQGIKYWFG